jgi:hypothetical protein
MGAGSFGLGSSILSSIKYEQDVKKVKQKQRTIAILTIYRRIHITSFFLCCTPQPT